MLAAVDKNYNIGHNGKLLFKIPGDLKAFKERTSGGIVIMGRKTYESIGYALPNRLNIVISRQKIEPVSNNMMVMTYEESLKYIDAQPKNSCMFVIGGGEIYRLYADKCTAAIITYVDKEAENADTDIKFIKEWAVGTVMRKYDYDEITYFNTK